MNKTKRIVQFYKGRKMYTFRVNDINDARKALKRCNVPAGYYVEKNIITGRIESNTRIEPFSPTLF